MARHLDLAPRFWHTDGAMGSASGHFYFRNRRWLLLSLFVLAWLFVPLSHVSTGRQIARFLAGAAGGAGRVPWGRLCDGLAALLAGVGAFWRTWGSAYLGANVVQDRRLHTGRLIASGPYRRTRNPLYFGNLLLALGVAMLVNPVAGAIFVVGMWVLVRLFIRDEENGMEETQGDSYRVYRSAVPRLVPAWRARVPAADLRPHWAQGFCGESFLWMFAGLTVGLAVTSDPNWYGKGLLWGLIISVPLVLWAKRHSRRAALGSA